MRLDGPIATEHPLRPLRGPSPQLSYDHTASPITGPSRPLPGPSAAFASWPTLLRSPAQSPTLLPLARSAAFSQTSFLTAFLKTCLFGMKIIPKTFLEALKSFPTSLYNDT